MNHPPPSVSRTGHNGSKRFGGYHRGIGKGRANLLVKEPWRRGSKFGVSIVALVILSALHAISTSIILLWNEKSNESHGVLRKQPNPSQSVWESSLAHDAKIITTSTRPRQDPPRKMSSTTNPIYFVHIGKTGGTSIDKLIKGILKDQWKEKPTSFRKYYGDGHYDWSFIQHEQRTRQSKGIRSGNQNKYITESIHEPSEYDVSFNADVITMLRHPVSRAISQFYYSQTMRWARNSDAPFVNMTFEDYLTSDPETSGFRDPLIDGLGGVSYLAGTTQAEWIASDGSSKEYLKRNKTALCLRAARRLDQTVWFGLLEDIERSTRLLELTMDLDTDVRLPRSNAASKHIERPSPSKRALAILEDHLPQDLWLYEYAKRLFEARWEYFTGDAIEYVHPELPPLPHFSSSGSGG